MGFRRVGFVEILISLRRNWSVLFFNCWIGMGDLVWVGSLWSLGFLGD